MVDGQNMIVVLVPVLNKLSELMMKRNGELSVVHVLGS